MTRLLKLPSGKYVSVYERPPTGCKPPPLERAAPTFSAEPPTAPALAAPNPPTVTNPPAPAPPVPRQRDFGRQLLSLPPRPTPT